MYLLHAPTSNDRLIPAVITSVLLAGMLIALHVANLPNVKQRTESYEEINWTRFTPKPKKIVAAPKPAPIKIEQPVQPELPPPVTPQPAPVQKIDLSALKAQFQSIDKPTRDINRTKTASEKSKPAATNGRINLQKSSALQGLNTLLGSSSSRLNVTSRSSKGRAGGGAPAIKAGSNSAGLGTSTNYGGSGPSLAAPAGKTNNADAIEIGMFDVTRMTGDFADLSPIYRELIEWMKRNPTRFPEVVGRFMERNADDLTSVVSFNINGRQFDMYLLCKENLFEVRVCLLEGNESTYLIDRGFKESSSFLRTGSVNRTPRGNILSFGTTRKAAADNRTSAFYQVFLSWWESVK